MSAEYTREVLEDERRGQYPGIRASSSTALCASHGVASELVHSSKNFGTVAGDGPESYATNSASQRNAVHSLLPFLTAAVDQVKLPPSQTGPLVVADFGCASGPNSLKNVDHIIMRLKERYLAGGLSVPEFQVFFQDLPTNDFNHLFHLLDRENNTNSSGKYLAAGAPGSFYGRLLPRSSVHVVFSSYSLHWMSKVPDAVLDKSNPAYNKGRSWVQGATPEVGAAYKEQAASDLRTFLGARAEELVPGGLLFLLFLGRVHPDPVKVLEGQDIPGDLWNLVDTVLHELVSEGTISEELGDSYNGATYLRSFDEVTSMVETFSSEFQVDRLEALPCYHFADYLARFGSKDDLASPQNFGMKVLLMFKATKAPQIEAHIGTQLSEVFWEKYTKIFFNSEIVDRFYSLIEKPGEPFIQVLVSLIRK